MNPNGVLEKRIVSIPASNSGAFSRGKHQRKRPVIDDQPSITNENAAALEHE
jgi:hypothetical protein